MPDQVKNHTFQEKSSLTKEKVPVNAEERDVNDYCPRTQLRKMFLSCGKPCLSVQEEKYEDGSSTLIPVDVNRTKDKIFAGIDRFIEEYAGENLRRVAVRDANKYLTTCIENEVKKKR